MSTSHLSAPGAPSYHFQPKEALVASTSTATKPQLDRLAAEFPGGDIKGRSQGGKTLTYISIDATIRRLNEVLGSNWSIDRANTNVVPTDNGRYFASTELFLKAIVDGVEKTAYGVGAMTNPDPDMAMKTALAEALKKAGHQLGIALYLWDEDARTRADSRMKLAKNPTEAALKKAVFDLAEQKLERKPTSAAEVAKAVGVTAGALADKDTLVQILTEAGVL